MDKIGTITASVFKRNTTTSFEINSDNEVVVPVSYIIEDALKKY